MSKNRLTSMASSQFYDMLIKIEFYKNIYKIIICDFQFKRIHTVSNVILFIRWKHICPVSITKG